MTTLCVLALILTACGGDDDDGDANETPPPANPPGASAPPPPPPSGGEEPSAPTISGHPPAMAMAGESYAFQPTVSSHGDGALSFSAASLPSWVSFNASNGRLSGTPEASHVGSYDGITITVSNDAGAATLGPFSILVVDVAYGSVTLSWLAPTENEDGSPLDDLAGYRIYYGETSGAYDKTITVNGQGQTNYVVEGLLPRTYYFAVTAYTSSGLESGYSNEASATVDET
jgi:hypothetical protein